MTDWQSWDERDAAAWIAVPQESSDKYSRGVLGVVTGSDRYPGAAVLGVEGASRTGVGMIRYLGADRPAEQVMRRRPEVVTAPGRVQGWLIGSGMDAASRPADDAQRLRSALRDGTPLVIDAGALDLVGRASAPVVVTPHFRELATVLAAGADDDSDAVTADDIAADPAGWTIRAAESLGVTVLLKGHTTYVAAPGGPRYAVTAGPAWLATAGSGDVLGGVLGALVATHAREIDEDGHTALAALAATAAWVHGRAGERASDGGPIVALDIVGELPGVVRELVRAAG
ncbi:MULTISPECIES: ADP-dependent NAD(P)H-hydrate dehydratase [Microbacteriaceae]|uniref:ADP-dependent NAD(P)H-hydrate dehydratase n=1 Tax=Microbacteriaceae TaxID=85023 RepID=UPI000363D6A1|nr:MULTISPECIES: ADP/ATP-dependent (S)-NAD(P)H-hydrate dehydratase [Microbacteriaceae]TDQ02940.1 NAD(P)H-hydrate repair Nnr-like enzyme with NAD(P)H-hydrate dehydratase domain [Leifsonia sp. 115AMFTsu3.1]